MADIKAHLQTNLTQAEQLGDVDRAERLKARIAELEKVDVGVSASNTKVELLEAAVAAGVVADESMTKAEILEALEAE
jgi:hypothetical protein